MHDALKIILTHLINKKYMGGRHTFEDRLIRLKTRHIERAERKEFDKEYKMLINEGFILRLKKRTGKGSDWHISLNPGKLKELKEKMNE